jgi:transcription antitermination factor NusG
MPLLRSEPNVFPDNLLRDNDHVLSSERCWHVARTLPRQEKALARQLRKLQVPFYLPIISRRLRSSKRTLTAHIPLFPGYVFVFADSEERLAELSTRRVAQSLAVVDQEELWRDLRLIDQLIASGAPITPEDRLVPGTRVTIRSGPLMGMEGTFVRTASGNRLVVHVNFIQRGASILLDDFAIEEL